jgi:hypothetical protein
MEKLLFRWAAANRAAVTCETAGPVAARPSDQ